MSRSNSFTGPNEGLPTRPQRTSRSSSPTGSIGSLTLAASTPSRPASPAGSSGGVTLTEALGALLDSVSAPSTYASTAFGTPRAASTPITRPISRDPLLGQCPEHLRNVTVRVPEANFGSFIARLEAATSRLEDLVPTTDSADTATDGSTEAPQNSASRNVSGPSGPSSTLPPGPSEQMPPAIQDFNTLIKTEVKVFVDHSQRIGSHVADQVRLPFCVMIRAC